MSDWWLRLSPRERQMVALGVGVALALLGYFMVWQPSQQRLRSLRANVTELRNDLVWMKAAASEVNRLRQIHPRTAAQPAPAQSLLTLVDGAARGAGLDSALKRLEPKGENMLTLRFEQASFDGIVQWLATLAGQYGVSVADATVERTAQTGRIDAQLVLRGGPR